MLDRNVGCKQMYLRICAYLSLYARDNAKCDQHMCVMFWTPAVYTAPYEYACKVVHLCHFTMHYKFMHLYLHLSATT